MRVFRIFIKVRSLARKLQSCFRVIYYRFIIGFNSFEQVFIADGVRISVTDGGAIKFNGPKTSVDRNATIIVKKGSLFIGGGGYIGIGSLICARESVSIGENALIAEYVTIRDQDHSIETVPYKDSGFKTAPIIIGCNVWLGAKVTVTKGVTIGDNSVIGANSVVTNDIPPNVVAAGAPARVIRQLDVTA